MEALGARSPAHAQPGGQEAIKYVHRTCQTREEQISGFPLHEMDDPKALSDAAWARQALLHLIMEIEGERHRPRFVCGQLDAFRGNVFQAAVWGKLRYGWPTIDVISLTPTYERDPYLSAHISWDEDGNPTHQLGR